MALTSRTGWRLLASAALMAGACSPSGASRPDEGTQAQKPPEVSSIGAAEGPADEATTFAMGNLLFVMFHELGHALITEFELPVLGREEDAVDNFASLLLTPDETDPEMDASILVDAMTGWFASAAMTEMEEIAWWGEHGPDQQRAYQIACLLYGSQSGAYDELAEQIGLPAERRERCAGEYQSVYASWGKLLAPHILEDGEVPPQRITVAYEDAGEYEPEQALMKESELMETLANEISTSFRLPRALRLKAVKCGEPNAFWDPEAGEITVCYELLRDYRELYAQLAAADEQPAD